MSTTALYNFSPALNLMMMGLIIAIGPLTWVWLRNRKTFVVKRLHVLTLMILFLTFDLVMFGAFTRLTNSGLGCPDWPGCYGHMSPVGARLSIDAAQSAQPNGPVTHPKAWIEMIHRYLATGVGVMILTLTVSSWLERKRHQLSTRLPLAILFWVCLQGAFGALTVTMKLFPLIVTLHLLGGMVLLAILKVQAVRYAQAQGEHLPVTLPTQVWILLWTTFALLWLQIALGGWVSTNYAVMACTDFPACQNSLWPVMDFGQGFSLWRELGVNSDGSNISFAALTAIHYVHRLSAYIVFALMVALTIKLYRVPALRTQARWLGGLAVLQVATGLGNVLLGWPLLAAVIHTGGAGALVIVLTGIVLSSRNAFSLANASKLNVSR